jgi:hypothetical protein
MVVSIVSYRYQPQIERPVRAPLAPYGAYLATFSLDHSNTIDDMVDTILAFCAEWSMSGFFHLFDEYLGYFTHILNMASTTLIVCLLSASLFDRGRLPNRQYLSRRAREVLTEREPDRVDQLLYMLE